MRVPPLDAGYEAQLVAIAADLPDKPLVLVGGVALSMYPFFDRKTDDLDLVIASDDAAIYEALSDSPAWTSTRLRFRWRHERTRTLVDVLPFQPGSEDALELPDGHRLSRKGMAHLGDVAQHVGSVPAHVRVAPLAAITVLKMVAWMDRPAERAKDLADLRLILANYEQGAPGDYSDRLVDAWYDAPRTDWSLEQAGAWLLGRDVAAMLSAAAMETVRRFVSSRAIVPEEAEDPHDPFVTLLPWFLRGLDSRT
ncbi:MAG: nucleotidyl transferase AbiEii/AbiGii toxin family protein [Myxococcales bacterium]|nr:nucleotidyl transferase AbiEii/AbiGii toxin family protein [Myxococcales bacterium]